MPSRETPGPKTHSRILWHFTGGPIWDNERSIQTKTPKPESAAYDALKLILKSRKLKLGGYHELLKILVDNESFYDHQKKKIINRTNQIKELKTSPVCCVSDIPLSELHFHSKRYGRIAIGFHREALVRSNFNPVFYTPIESQVVRNFYSAQRTISLMDSSAIEWEIENLMSEIENQTECRLGELALEVDGSGIAAEAEMMVSSANDACGCLEDSLAFVKTYQRSDFEKIYAEREWRSTSEFFFETKDVAMVLIPSSGSVDYFDKMTRQDLQKLNMPRSVSIVRWEDVVV